MCNLWIHKSSTLSLLQTLIRISMMAIIQIVMTMKVPILMELRFMWLRTSFWNQILKRTEMKPRSALILWQVITLSSKGTEVLINKLTSIMSATSNKMTLSSICSILSGMTKKTKISKTLLHQLKMTPLNCSEIVPIANKSKK